MRPIDASYPRPHFVRTDWLSLDGSWEYSFSERRRVENVSWEGTIQVPFPPESELSGVKDTGFHPVIWYRRSFTAPAEWQGKRLMLNFGAVDYSSQVWVNGELVAEHIGGHTPFSVDITEYLVEGEQEVVVRAGDDPLDLEKPRGKQDWQAEPHAIWYPRTTGIWQPVWLEPVADTFIALSRITPDLDGWKFNLDVEMDTSFLGPLKGLKLEARLTRNGKPLVKKTFAVKELKATGELILPAWRSEDERESLLWSPENPALFEVELTLRADKTVLDKVESYTGMRSVEARDGSFFLNGKPYFLQMVLDQGYWTESLLAAPSGDALRKDVELTKAMGFNGARKHQKIEDPRYLYWADRLGLIVWGELPSAYKFSRLTAQRVTDEFIAMIERDCNHPCIVAWVPFNESWGIPDVKKSAAQRHLAQTLYHMAKALDGTRLVIENDGWEHCQTDLFTVHDYENAPDVYSFRYNCPEGLEDALLNYKRTPKWALEGFKHQGLPVILSEFGGVRIGGKKGSGWGYNQVSNTDEFLLLFAPLMMTVYGRILTGYCYTQLTDTFQEENGLLYADRTPKVPVEQIAQILRDGMQRRLDQASLLAQPKVE